MMKNLIYLLSILSLNLALFSQENNVENIEVTPSKIEQLIIDNKSSGDETVTISMDGGSGWK